MLRRASEAADTSLAANYLLALAGFSDALTTLSQRLSRTN